MFGLQGFADCDGDGCKAQELLKIGLVPNAILMFDLKALVPTGWYAVTEHAVIKVYCPSCWAKKEAEHKKSKLKVVLP